MPAQVYYQSMSLAQMAVALSMDIPALYAAIPTTIPAPAAPAANVGLSVVAGSAATYMRSDAAPPIDQTIAPTWTGAHTFSAALQANGGLTVAGAAFTSRGIADNATSTSVTIAAGRNVSVGSPTSGVALQVVGVGGASFTGQVATFTGPNTASQSNGLIVRAGTNANDAALIVVNAANSGNQFVIYGDGSVVIGNPTGGPKGPGTLNVQGTLYVNGVAVTVP